MKAFAVFGAAAALLTSAASGDEGIEVRLVHCQIGMPLGDEVPFEVKPMGHEPGVQLSFLVRGENLVAFKDDSVEVATFKLADGREWARTRAGKENWKQGSFSKVDEEGKTGSFTVAFPGKLFGQVEGATLQGSIVLVTATAAEVKEVELPPGQKEGAELGPFKISTAGAGGFFGGNRNDQTSVTVEGNHESVIEVKVMDGETELDSSGSSWSGKRKTYHFSKADGDKLKISVRYWTDMEESELQFGFGEDDEE